MAAAFTNCPTAEVQPGSSLTLNGTTDDCATTTRTAIMNGQALPINWSCIDGTFTMKIQVGDCEDGQSNILEARVKQGTSGDTCTVTVACS